MESMATLGDPGPRLRHPLRPRHLPAGAEGRLAASSCPRTGCPPAIRGSSSGPRSPTRSASAARSTAIEDDDGTTRYVWEPAESVNAVAFDTPIAGWRGRHVNTLRLWSARATDPLRLEDFNRGDHVGALADRVRLEAISRVLYPSDDTAAGHELRLRQEYLLRLGVAAGPAAPAQGSSTASSRRSPTTSSIQLNDTHPAIAVAELMRLLVDVHGMPWELAWDITTSVFNYTNHTLLPEALETWPVSLMERLLPRHMQIIYLINALHLDRAARRGPRRRRASCRRFR